MENKAHALAAGIFVLALATLLLALAAWLARDGGDRVAYEIITRESISGLQPQAPVRLRGVDVGQVQAISFDPRSPGQVVIRLSVDRHAPVTRETFATLGFLGVTGLAFVQLDDDGRPAPLLAHEGATPPRIALRPGLVTRLAVQGEGLARRADEAAGRVNALLADANQQRLMAAIDQLGRASGSIERLSSQLSASTGALTGAAEDFRRNTLPRIDRAADETAHAARELAQLAASLRERPQSLLFGPRRPAPGTGEPGAAPPGKAR